MDYRIVRQYYNNAIDNFFNFFYKSIDFGKILIDTFWAFLEIWANFFGIFVNFFLFFYYLMLYFFDMSTLPSTGMFFFRKSYNMKAPRLKRVYTDKIFNPVPGMYGKQANVNASVVTETASAAIKATASIATEAFRPSGPTGSKGRGLKRLGEIIVDTSSSLWKRTSSFIIYYWKMLLGKLKPVQEQQPTRKSLIDDYMKEYEKKRSAKNK